MIRITNTQLPRRHRVTKAPSRRPPAPKKQPPSGSQRVVGKRLLRRQHRKRLEYVEEALHHRVQPRVGDVVELVAGGEAGGLVVAEAVLGAVWVGGGRRLAVGGWPWGVDRGLYVRGTLCALRRQQACIASAGSAAASRPFLPEEQLGKGFVCKRGRWCRALVGNVGNCKFGGLVCWLFGWLAVALGAIPLMKPLDQPESTPTWIQVTSVHHCVVPETEK
jgi:hypothetical protein